MAVNQRDVYLLPHPINPQSEEYHPFIVLSAEPSNSHERTFIAVMITSSEFKKNEYSFPLLDEMFDHPLRKNGSHARMHLLMLCLPEEVKGGCINRMKPFYFKKLMQAIGESVFNYEFIPLDE